MTIGNYYTPIIYKGTKELFYEVFPGGSINRHQDSLLSQLPPAVATKTKSAFEIAKTKVDAKITTKLRNGWSISKDDQEKCLKPMLLHDFTKYEHKIQYPCIVQPKLDGIRCLWNPETQRLMTRGGKEVHNEHIREIIGYLQSTINRSDFLDGELHCPGVPLQEVIHMISKEDTRLIFSIFDIPVENIPFKSRLKTLYECYGRIVSKLASISIVPSEVSMSPETTQDIYNTWIAGGSEGVVVKNIEGLYKFDYRSCDILKYKPVFDKEFRINAVDYDISPSGQRMICFLCRTDENKEFKVTPSWSHDERARLYTKWLSDDDDRVVYHGKMLTVEYRGISNDGIPLHAVGKAIREDI